MSRTSPSTAHFRRSGLGPERCGRGRALLAIAASMARPRSMRRPDRRAQWVRCRGIAPQAATIRLKMPEHFQLGHLHFGHLHNVRLLRHCSRSAPSPQPPILFQSKCSNSLGRKPEAVSLMVTPTVPAIKSCRGNDLSRAQRFVFDHCRLCQPLRSITGLVPYSVY
jgi:hypothetical protein